ncbi:MAG: MobC family plasmid mobilization relaxosome protein, partial [bacterium]|nr:MobC family plasmid mobilization relaxosome protein [bacterium]
AKVTGVTASEIIRQAIKRVRTWTLADRKTEREKISQIAKIGNNLNQIARWCNQNKGTADAIEVTTHLIAIERSLREL